MSVHVYTTSVASIVGRAYSHVRRENIMFTTCYTTGNCSPCVVSRTGAGNNEALIKNIYNMIQMNHDS